MEMIFSGLAVWTLEGIRLAVEVNVGEILRVVPERANVAIIEIDDFIGHGFPFAFIDLAFEPIRPPLADSIILTVT